jgi:hypothetical protein
MLPRYDNGSGDLVNLPACPECGDNEEVGTDFEWLWCCKCGKRWRSMPEEWMEL